MADWEEKFDEFKNQSLATEIDNDNQQEAVAQQMLDYVQAHENEIKELIKSDQHSDTFPRDDVFTYELDTDIEGHHLYWSLEYAVSRDGDEDSDGEFEIDGQYPKGRAAMNLDQYLADLCYTMQ